MTVINTSPYMRTTREFPEEMHKLTVEVNKAWLDTAKAVNERTIGLYPTTRPAITGNSYFFSLNLRQQSIRQVYQFTAAGSIPHGINTTQIWGFASITGTFTDGTNWYPLPYVSETGATNQISIQVTPTNIVITAGAGAPPTITKGIVILEWITLT
jgi:hypothetical protein